MKYQSIEKIKFVILILLLILVNSLINHPFFTRLKEIKNELRSEVARLELASNLKQSPQETLNRYQQIDNYSKSKIKSLLRQGEELQLFEELEKLAIDNQLVHNLSINQSTTEINENVYKLDLRLNLRGDYYHLLNYLNELTKFNYQLTVKSLNLNQYTQELELTLLASSFWLYEKSEKN